MSPTRPNWAPAAAPTTAQMPQRRLTSRVNGGHLLVEDGTCRHRRQRRYSRQRLLRRLVRTCGLPLRRTRCRPHPRSLAHLRCPRQPTARRWPHPAQGADPINALLNYGYALAEIECRLAAITSDWTRVSGLGTPTRRTGPASPSTSSNRSGRSSNATCCSCWRHAISGPTNSMRPGLACRLLAALTHELAKQLAVYARAMAEPAETVARLIAGSRPGCIDLATPRSRGNTAARQVRGERGAERQPVTVATPAPSCRICGVKLADKSRQLCPSCWPVTRNKIAAERVKAANAARGHHAGRRNRSHQHTGRRQTIGVPVGSKTGGTGLAAWRGRRSLDTRADEREVLPALAAVPLSSIMRATGLDRGVLPYPQRSADPASAALVAAVHHPRSLGSPLPLKRICTKL
jgi:hypothetical protein